MSYVSLLKNIPEVLSQPAGIAAIASVGIHGAIALIVPLMPVDSSQSKESASAKSVGIVELNQADQARLPQTPDQAQVALQPQPPDLLPQQQLPQQPQVTLPNLDTKTSLMPAIPPAYMQPISPPITTTPNKYRTNYLPKQFSKQWVMPKDTFGDTSGFNAANTKPNTSRSDSSGRGITAFKQQSGNYLPEVNRSPLPLDLKNSQPLSPSVAPTTIADSATTSPTNQPGGFQVPQNQPLINPPGQPSNLVNNLTPTGRSASPNTSPPKIPELAKPSKDGNLLALAAHAKLRDKVLKEYPNSQEKPVIRETITTDKPSLEGTVSGFLVVDSQGKHVIKYEDKPVAPELKLKITEYFNSKAPKGDKQTNIYPFNLRFQNNSNNTAGATQGQTPGVVTPQPVSTPAKGNQQTPPPVLPSFKPLSEQVPGNQPTPSPATTNKLMQELRNRNGKSAPASTTPVKPSSTQEANKTQVSPSVTPTSSQNLIRELNKFRQERQNSNSEK
ncbi:hypothetical protein I8748_01510 [Nostoc sp. CENA67]|uniref:Uncharacterized protein n=1 Tax=Amazonocrinis nigriterrae CENA67 TaxID=2794033 RepID=A0A8J7HPD7_9NOST|nr:hypothetical protein [Amazonocrinis nigriterrae]MBH8560867.1 hypothetical protein [Amazonocrinis nigriterrae CENA67]